MQTAARASMTRISRSKSIDRLLFVSTSSSPSNEPPASIVSRQQLNNLRQKTANVVDLDALEVARQITLIDSKVYCSIKVFELVGQEFMNKESAVAVNVKAMSTLSNGITTWVAESILKDADPKKRAVVVKFFIKVAEKLLSLNNFKSLVDILCAINSSTIDRLRKTWNVRAAMRRDGGLILYSMFLHGQRHCSTSYAKRWSIRGTMRNIGLD